MFQGIPFIPTIYDSAHHILPSDHKFGVVLIESRSESQPKNSHNRRVVISTERDQEFLECARCLDLDIAVEFHAIFPHVTGSPTTAAAHPLRSL
jgi:hypothetical protein